MTVLQDMGRKWIITIVQKRSIVGLYLISQDIWGKYPAFLGDTTSMME